MKWKKLFWIVFGIVILLCAASITVNMISFFRNFTFI